LAIDAGPVGPLRIYFDHNVVQHGSLRHLLDDAGTPARFSVVVSEAHYVEALLCCRAGVLGGRLVRMTSERRDAIVHGLASDYRAAVRSDNDELRRARESTS